MRRGQQKKVEKRIQKLFSRRTLEILPYLIYELTTLRKNETFRVSIHK